MLLAAIGKEPHAVDFWCKSVLLGLHLHLAPLWHANSAPTPQAQLREASMLGTSIPKKGVLSFAISASRPKSPNHISRNSAKLNLLAGLAACQRVIFRVRLEISLVLRGSLVPHYSDRFESVMVGSSSSPLKALGEIIVDSQSPMTQNQPAESVVPVWDWSPILKPV